MPQDTPSDRCQNCGSGLDLGPNRFLGMREECPKCRVDLHCCTNCEHHNPDKYNGCNEPNAERLTDKSKGNKCEYFRFISRSTKLSALPSKSEKFKALDQLFKK